MSRPFDPDFGIHFVTLSMDRSRAWVSSENSRDHRRANRASHVLEVDLDTGAWKQHVHGHAFATTPYMWLSSPHRSWSARSRSVVVQHPHNRDATRVLDTQSGKTILDFHDRDRSTMHALENSLVELHELTQLRDGEGRPWSIVRRDGTREVLIWNDRGDIVERRPLPMSIKPGWRIGQGLRCHDSSKSGRDTQCIYDVDRDRVYPMPDNEVFPIVRAGPWILRTVGTIGWDPDTGILSEVLGVESGDDIRQSVGHHWLYVTNNERRETALVDPESGQRIALPLPREVDDVRGAWVESSAHGTQRFFIRRLGRLGGQETTLFAFDIESATLRVAADPTTRRFGEAEAYVDILCAESEDSLLVRSRASIFRVRFDGSPPERLWPREHSTVK